MKNFKIKTVGDIGRIVPIPSRRIKILKVITGVIGIIAGYHLLIWTLTLLFVAFGG